MYHFKMHAQIHSYFFILLNCCKFSKAHQGGKYRRQLCWLSLPSSGTVSENGTPTSA